MQNFIKTILSGVQNWTKEKIKELDNRYNKRIIESTADWEQNDSSADDYVKNRTHWEERDEIYIVPEQTVTVRDDTGPPILSESGLKLTVGETYIVELSGVTYECVARQYDRDTVIIGNSEVFEGKLEWTGEPFAITSTDTGIIFLYSPIYGIHTVSVYGPHVITHKISSRYLELPDTVVTAYDMEEAVGSKMDKHDPEGHGTFSINRATHHPIGWNSVSLGSSSVASGSYSHATGNSTTASGDYSTANGSLTTASGKYSHSSGYRTTASGYGGRTEGVYTQATTDATSTPTKYSSSTYGYATHAEGYGTVACGSVSHAEGNGTKASGSNSHAEGESTTASGYASHAEGYYTIASGDYSHAEGYNTTSVSDCQHVQGRYNVLYRLSFNDTKEKISLYVSSSYVYSSEYTFDPFTGVISLINAKSAKPNMIQINSSPIYLEHNGVWYQVLDNFNDYTASTFTAIKINIVTYAHIVGNGTSEDARSNAHTLDWGGVGWFQGGLQVGGNAQDDGAKSVLLEGDAIPIPENATVGQTIAVKSVDENGKPVEWETTDISTSGGSGCVASDTAPEDTSVIWIDTSDNSAGEIPGSAGSVIYDEAQNLTDAQKAQARDNIGAQPAGNYLTEVPEGYAKTEDVPTDAEIIQLIKDNAPESSGSGIAVTGAKVGQTVKISAVDENGVPTAWEPTDFLSGVGGGAERMHLITDFTTTEDLTKIVISEDKDGKPFSLSKIAVRGYVIGGESGGYIGCGVNNKGFFTNKKLTANNQRDYYWYAELNDDGTINGLFGGEGAGAFQVASATFNHSYNQYGDNITSIYLQTGTNAQFIATGSRFVIYGA